VDLPGDEATFDRLIELGAVDAERQPDGTLAALMPDSVAPEQLAGVLGVENLTVSAVPGRDAGSVWVLDIRPVGLTVGIDLASKPDGVGKRGMEALDLGFFDHDVMFRAVGDTLALSPPLIVSENQIGEIFDKLARIIKAVA